MGTIIHWFRRDLRITDNTALAAASRDGELVVAVYVLSVWKDEHAWTGPHRQAFLCGSLEALDGRLRSIGGTLTLRCGEQVRELVELAREVNASAIYANRDPDPFGRDVEGKLGDALAEEGIELKLFQDVCIHERNEVLNGSDEPYKVFTPYSKAWRKLAKREAAGRLRKLDSPKNVKSVGVPSLKHWGLKLDGDVMEPGEEAARARLTRWVNGGIAAYDKTRDTPSGDTTSRLSQDLRWGLLSIREVYERCAEKERELDPAGRKGAGVYVGELIWREFYQAILWHWPEVLEKDFNPRYGKVRWPGKDAEFERWQAGETGFPIVDAAMRHLAATGFMPNRCRMITAMFLTKDLHVHWRRGESHFMQQLTDGEIASNNGGWQWSAGTGADAAPYFRIQNPWTQSERFDPKGEYVREWIPELRDVEPKRFLGPPEDGESLAKGYPKPIVDHGAEREKTLELFKKGKTG
ncbi:MAG: deoxyribodipyrimidine photo-lyase [Chthoniobacterales bacterium]